jgi:hypothetical protein
MLCDVEAWCASGVMTDPWIMSIAAEPRVIASVSIFYHASGINSATGDGQQAALWRLDPHGEVPGWRPLQRPIGRSTGALATK